MWIFLGWKFTLAEFVGGFILIALMWLGLRLFVSRRLEEEAREHALAAQTGTSITRPSPGRTCFRLLHGRTSHTTPRRPEDALEGARRRLPDCRLRVAAADGVLQRLFITDRGGVLQLLENVVVGRSSRRSRSSARGEHPACRGALAGGISFSGVIAFVYAT